MKTPLYIQNCYYVLEEGDDVAILSAKTGYFFLTDQVGLSLWVSTFSEAQEYVYVDEGFKLHEFRYFVEQVDSVLENGYQSHGDFSGTLEVWLPRRGRRPVDEYFMQQLLAYAVRPDYDDR